jgi:hypothetical protein
VKEIRIPKPSKGDLTEKGFNKSIKIRENQTEFTLKEYGFTNHNEPTLYYHKNLGDDISFNLSVNKQTLHIEGIDVLDENFLQPYDYQEILTRDSKHKLASEIYHKVNKILTRLQDDLIIEGFQVGMYV